MDADPRPLLSALPEERLRSLAAARGLNADGCHSKGDLVALLATHGVVPEVDLARLEVLLSARRPSDLRDLAARHGLDVSRARKRRELAAVIAGSPAAVQVWSEVAPPMPGPSVPSMEDPEVDRLLYEATTMAVDFGQTSELLAHARLRFEGRDFRRVIGIAEEAVALADAAEEAARRAAWAYAILSCQHLVEDCARAGRNVEEAANLVRDAKRAFREDRLRSEPELLRRLGETVRSLHSQERDRAEVGIAEVSRALENGAAIGASLGHAEGVLARARDALAADDPFLSLQLVAYAERLAQEAIDARVQDIEEGLQETEALITEARIVGGDVAEAERLLAQARVAFDEKQVFLAGDLVKRSERSVMRTQQSQIEKAIDLHRRHLGRALAVLAGVEPVLAEADAFGIDTAEARVLVAQARDVLATGDTVNGTTFARHAARAVRALDPRLVEERAKRGIRKPVSGVCGSCASRRLLFRDDGWAQCLECGRVSRWRTAVQVWRRFRKVPRP